MRMSSKLGNSTSIAVISASEFDWAAMWGYAGLEHQIGQTLGAEQYIARCSQGTHLCSVLYFPFITVQFPYDALNDFWNRPTY